MDMTIIQYCRWMQGKGEGISRQAVLVKINKNQPIKYVIEAKGHFNSK